MLKVKPCCCAAPRRVPPNLPLSRSRRIVGLLHTQPSDSPIRGASTDPPNQMAHFQESRRIRVESEYLCRSQCVAFPVYAVSCRIAEYVPRRTKHYSRPSDLRSRILSSTPLFR